MHVIYLQNSEEISAMDSNHSELSHVEDTSAL